MNSIIEKLNRRLARNKTAFPCLHWPTWLFLTGNLVLIAFFIFDVPVAIHQAAAIPLPLREASVRLTYLGKSGWIIFASLMIFFEGLAVWRIARAYRTRLRAIRISYMALYMFLAVALSGLSANLLKRAIGRARPEEFTDWGTFGFLPFAGRSDFESFPSGHSTTAGAFFTALALMSPRYRILFLVIGVWIGTTRVIVGAHYPSDVIAGLAWGGWFAFMLAVVFSRYGLVFSAAPGCLPALRYPLPFGSPKTVREKETQGFQGYAPQPSGNTPEAAS